MRVFGAPTQRYEQSPPLSGAEIEAVEQYHGIALPTGYRTFLHEAGNRGAGPGYGLFPLADYAVNLTDLPHDFLARPFPHREPWQPSVTDEDAYFDNYWIQGTVRLCHYGCGFYGMLVVSGAERGHIWRDDRSSDYGIHPDADRADDFLAWYEDWLDTSLRECGVR